MKFNLPMERIPSFRVLRGKFVNLTIQIGTQCSTYTVFTVFSLRRLCKTPFGLNFKPSPVSVKELINQTADLQVSTCRPVLSCQKCLLVMNLENTGKWINKNACVSQNTIPRLNKGSWYPQQNPLHTKISSLQSYFLKKSVRLRWVVNKGVQAIFKEDQWSADQSRMFSNKTLNTTASMRWEH